jgi:hypothetical protein
VASVYQLYRERADSENPFDELKNQWSWAGFTTQDFGRCQLMARSVALVYNWGSLFLRLVDRERHRDVQRQLFFRPPCSESARHPRVRHSPIVASGQHSGAGALQPRCRSNAMQSSFALVELCCNLPFPHRYRQWPRYVLLLTCREFVTALACSVL